MQRAGLRGRQEPRFLFRPEFVSEAHGQEAIELAESVGLYLDPWQQLSVRVALAERADGKYAATEVAQLVARQNGKGGWLEAVVLDGLFLVQDPLTLWTAHQFKTTTEAFLRIKGWIDGSDDLRRKVKRVSSAHGDEGIELLSGARLRFIARSKSSGRGFSPQRVIWDEAQELSTAAVDAMLPGMRAQANKQSLFVGTVPNEETNHPEHFTRLRNRGRSRTGKRLVWMEWSPPGSEDPAKAERIALDSRRVWQWANPGLGYRITEESLADDYEAMSAASFARETLSIWPTLPDEEVGVIDLGQWAALANADGRLKKNRGVALAVDVKPGRDRASIAVAGPARGSDRTLVMVLCGAGTDWVVPRVKKLLAKHGTNVLDLAVDPAGPVGALLPDFEAAGIRVTLMTARTMGQACGGFQTLISDGRLEHLGQSELDTAVKTAKVRTVGDAELWDRKDRSIDLSPLVAASVAAHAYTTHQGEDYDPVDSIG